MRWEVIKLSNLDAIEIKAFVPARDFELSKKFYLDLGFEVPWSDSQLAYVRFQNCSFLLQNFYIKEHAENFVMHLLVESADSWWEKIQSSGIVDKYATFLSSPEDRDWKMRDFTINDPSGILWRIGNNID